MIVDADAHVVENDATWDHLEREHAHLRPIAVHPKGSLRRYWFIDGRTRGLGARVLDPQQMEAHTTATGRDVRVPTHARDLNDVSARLEHMTKCGIDVQVLLPTLFLEQVADRPEVEVPLCRAYNRWLATIWKQSNGRLRWAVVPPLLAMDEAIRELERGKEHGACAVFLRPIEGSRLPSDPYFAPLYRAAGELDLAISIHVGNANPNCRDLLSRNNPEPAFWAFRLSLVGAFHALVLSGAPEAFPNVRWGFLEAGAQWLPFALQDLRRRLAGSGRGVGPDFLTSQRAFVACMADEDLDSILAYAGHDSLIIGTDYGHADTSSDLEALGRLSRRDGLPSGVVEKILSVNPCRLYGL
jgi:predicted TIM-barrel fold metal-dependent hydrolase